MTTDIKELVRLLLHSADLEPRENGRPSHSELVKRNAAAALEAMAGEVARARLHEDCANGVAAKVASGYQKLLTRAEAAEAERDRLAGEVERLEQLTSGEARIALATYAEAARQAKAERDRLKAALQVIASDPTHSGQAVIARKALGGDA